MPECLNVIMMNKVYPLSLALSLLSLPCVAPAAGPKISPQDDVVAMVNNEPITREALIRRVLAYYGSKDLEAMINQTLVRQAAERDKITVADREVEERVAQTRSMMRTPELFQQWLRETWVSEPHYREQVRYTLLTEKVVLKRTPIADSDLDRVRTRVILVQTEAEAKAILSQLKQGSD